MATIFEEFEELIMPYADAVQATGSDMPEPWDLIDRRKTRDALDDFIKGLENRIEELESKIEDSAGYCSPLQSDPDLGFRPFND